MCCKRAKHLISTLFVILHLFHCKVYQLFQKKPIGNGIIMSLNMKQAKRSLINKGSEHVLEILKMINPVKNSTQE